MEFNKTLLSSTLQVPAKLWRGTCLYMFLFKLPYVILVMTIGILIALVVDFFNAMSDLKT